MKDWLINEGREIFVPFLSKKEVKNTLKIYDEKGWLDIPKIIDCAEKNEINFIFIIGARRTGKTYGVFKHFIEDVFPSEKGIIYMRRTTTQLDNVLVDKKNPWIDINRDMGRNIFFKKVKGDKDRVVIAEKIYQDTDGEVIEYRGEAFSLTSMYNNRGFSGSEFSEGIYDEFIPEKMAKRMNGEADAFLNAVETISSNRELQGEKPFRWWLLSNSNTLDNPIVNAFGLLPYLEKMQKRGQEFSLLKNKGIMLILINRSPISEKKSTTALYRALSNDSDFSRMALKNEFAYDDTSCISSEDIRQYKLICTIGKIGIYEHKSECKLYIAEHISGSCKDNYEKSEKGISQFKTFYSWVDNYRLTDRISYQNLAVKFFIDNIFK